MKSFNRFTRACLTILFIGLSLAGIGFLLGGWTALEQHAIHNRRLETADFDKVESLAIQTSIIITPSKDDRFHLSYYRYLRDQTAPLSYQLSDKELTIRDIQPNSIINVNGLLDTVLHLSQQNWVEDRIPRLEVPKGTNLKELSGFVDIGDVQLEDVQIEHLLLNVNVGPVKLTNTKIGTLDLDVDTGDIALTNVSLAPQRLGAGSIRLNIGEITATNLSLAGDNSILTDIGSIDLKLNPKTAVTIDASSDIGSVSNDFQAQSTPKGQLILQTNMGDIRVR